MPKRKTSDPNKPSPDSGSIVVVWDPGAVSADEYLELVSALNKVAQSQGASGLVRLDCRPFKAPVGAEVPQ